MFPGLSTFRKMARKQCFLVCPPSGNMARKQCFPVGPPSGKWLGNNVYWFVHLQETWLGNNVFWFVHLLEAYNLSLYSYRPAPLLKDVNLTESKARELYLQCIKITRNIFWKARLVHADLSEFNMM